MPCKHEVVGSIPTVSTTMPAQLILGGFMHYNTTRYHTRRAELVKLLGSACTVCGSIERLQFHHVNPREKRFNIGSEFSRPWDEILDEVSKCTLLCEECHKLEHSAKHGISMYSHHKCRCDVCRREWNEKSRGYKAAAKARRLRVPSPV